MNVQIYYAAAAAAMDKEDPGKFGCYVQVLFVRPFSRPVGESGPPSVNRSGGGMHGRKTRGERRFVVGVAFLKRSELLRRRCLAFIAPGN